MSFTDNRQDASLQAGHLNDFVQVVLLRGALVSAIEIAGGEIGFDRLGSAIFDALAPEPRHFMSEPVASGPSYERARSAMIDLLEHRAIEDLARAWRVAQPNLEQCGLLQIEYAGLEALAGDDAPWAGSPAMAAARTGVRVTVLKAVCDHLRSLLIVDAEILDEDRTRSLKRRVNADLCNPWTFDEFESLRQQRLALLPGVAAQDRDRSVALRLGARSAIARYLRSRHTWGATNDLSAQEAEKLILDRRGSARPPAHCRRAKGCAVRNPAEDERPSLASSGWWRAWARSGAG